MSKLILPTDGVITDWFNTPGDRWRHAGVDIANVNPVPICAIADGVVQWVDWDIDYGEYARIWHEQFGFHSFYAHFVEGSTLVGFGQRVIQGQPLATMGSTGYSTGRHLHVEIRMSHDGNPDVYGYAAYGHGRGRVDPQQTYLDINGPTGLHFGRLPVIA